MQIGPDAISLGPLVLGWGRLALVLGLLVFLGLVSRRREARLDSVAWQGLVLGLIAARLAYGLLHFSSLSQNGMGEWLGSLADIRKGGLVGPVGLVVGLGWAFGRLRREALSLLPPALIALAIGLLPWLLHPVGNPSLQIGSDASFEAISRQGSQQTITWAQLPKPILINVWASWCGPCRSEMPLLDEYARQGYPIFFLNTGEPASTVQNYLQAQGLSLTAHLDTAGLAKQLAIRGLPTTLVVDSGTKISARHMGPVDRVQLQRLLERVKR